MGRERLRASLLLPCTQAEAPAPPDSPDRQSICTTDISISSFSSDAVGEDAGESSEGTDDPDDGQDGLAALARVHRGERRPAVPEVRYTFPPHGEIRYNTVSRYFRAYCAKHKDCAKQRTAEASANKLRRGQGRPLGLLAAFLLQETHETKKLHQKAPVGSREQRERARALLKAAHSQQEYEDFAKYERPPRRGEAEEPNHVP